MKRIYALAIGLVLAASGLAVAGADPVLRPAGHQQAIDAVVARALAQRGVPYTYGGGDASGPSRRPANVAASAPGGVAASTPSGVAASAPGGVAADPTVAGLALNQAPVAPSSDPTTDVVGFDASGLIVYAFAGVGLKLPRTSGEQYKVGWKVTPDQALPGDLMFYGPNGTQSVAMFLGNGQMLEATTPAVTVTPVRTTGMAPYLSRIIS